MAMDNSKTSKKVLDLCDEALAMLADERETFLKKLGLTEPDVASAVRELLRAIEDSGSFMTIADPRDRS